jgi:hypothetical protein
VDSEKVGGGIAQFELKEFEWYGDNPSTAGDRQVEVRKEMHATATAWHCDYVVAYVNADDLFSVSPIPGRHKVWSENICPVFDTTNIIVRQRIKPEIYNNAERNDRDYILQRARDVITEKIDGIHRNNTTIVTYEIWCADTLVTKGAVPA